MRRTALQLRKTTLKNERKTELKTKLVFHRLLIAEEFIFSAKTLRKTRSAAHAGNGGTKLGNTRHKIGSSIAKFVFKN